MSGAGVLAMFHTAKRIRWNAACIAIGFVGGVIASFVWANREGVFIDRLTARYRSSIEKAHLPLPPLLVQYIAGVQPR